MSYTSLSYPFTDGEIDTVHTAPGHNGHEVGEGGLLISWLLLAFCLDKDPKFQKTKRGRRKRCLVSLWERS
jgi:hypothetical protein